MSACGLVARFTERFFRAAMRTPSGQAGETWSDAQDSVATEHYNNDTTWAAGKEGRWHARGIVVCALASRRAKRVTAPAMAANARISILDA